MSLINTQITPFQPSLPQGQVRPGERRDLKGKWSVLVFYPADFTFVCPTELGDLADHYAEFQKLGVEIYGVSTDTHFTHKAWHDTSDTIRKIKYPLVGDPTATLTRIFGVLITEGEDRPGAARHLRRSTRRARSRPSKMHANGIGRDAKRNAAQASRPPSTSPPTPAKSAPPSGTKAPRR